jgi:hypothetical protein
MPNRLCAIPHCAESWLPATPQNSASRLCATWHCSEFFFNKKFHLQLRALQLNVKFESKFSSRRCDLPHRAESTHIRIYLSKIETKQWLREDCLWKKILGQKSRDTVALTITRRQCCGSRSGSGLLGPGPDPDPSLNKWPYLNFMVCVKAKLLYFRNLCFIAFWFKKILFRAYCTFITKKFQQKKLAENLYRPCSGSRRFQKSDPDLVKNRTDPQHCPAVSISLNCIIFCVLPLASYVQ